MVETYRSRLSKMPPKFSTFFDGKTYQVTEYVIYDPDTINIVLPVDGQMYTFSARMLGFDAIEKKLKKSELSQISQEDAQYLRNKYKQSEEFLNEFLNNKEFTVKTSGTDKYGRLLIDIYVNQTQGDKEIEVHLNKAIIDSGLVFSYQGQTKLTIQEQIEYLKQHDNKQ